VPDTAVDTAVDDPRAGHDGALGPLGALAGVASNRVTLLVWNYVAAPEKEANAVVMEDGYASSFATWNVGNVFAYFYRRPFRRSAPTRRSRSRWPRPSACSW
jgi:hypothetical protein